MLAFIIINYNTWEMTLKCVDSIFKTCKNSDYTIYIVDNGSKNDSYDILRKNYQNQNNVIIIKAENKGYAIGNNIGIKRAISDGHEYITIVNNDVIFLEDSIDKMYEFLRQNDDASVVSPYILSPEGELSHVPQLRYMNDKDYIIFNTHLRKFLKSETVQGFKRKYFLSEDIIKQDPILIYKFSGCCFMIKSEKMRELGMFDENTFLYYEEDILCYKMHKADFKAYFLPEAKIIHYHGFTTGKKTIFVDTEMLKSEMYFLSRYYKMNFIKLILIYADRLITPLLRKLRYGFNLTMKDYFGFVKKTWPNFINALKIDK